MDLISISPGAALRKRCDGLRVLSHRILYTT
jgi:hypothetical protein